jgi:hypothetical protein
VDSLVRHRVIQHDALECLSAVTYEHYSRYVEILDI